MTRKIIITVFYILLGYCGPFAFADVNAKKTLGDCYEKAWRGAAREIKKRNLLSFPEVDIHYCEKARDGFACDGSAREPELFGGFEFQIEVQKTNCAVKKFQQKKVRKVEQPAEEPAASEAI